MFDQKGQIIIDKEELEDECGEMDADELMMTALDAGAEDFNEEEDSFEIITAPDDFSAVREALEKAGIPLVEAQIAMITVRSSTLCFREFPSITACPVSRICSFWLASRSSSFCFPSSLCFSIKKYLRNLKFWRYYMQNITFYSEIIRPSLSIRQ